MTKHNETPGFKASDFVSRAEDKLGTKMDYVLINDVTKLSHEVLEKYAAEDAMPVEFDSRFDWSGRKITIANVASANGALRHDPDKFRKYIRSITKEL